MYKKINPTQFFINDPLLGDDFFKWHYVSIY